MRKGSFYSDEIGKKVIDTKILKRLLQYLKPYKLTFIIAIILLLAAAAADLVGPYLFKIAIDKYIVNGDILGLRKIAFLYLAIIILASLIAFFQMIITMILGQKVIYDIRSRLYNKLLNLSMNYFTMNPIGRLTTRVTNDVESLNEVFTAGFINIFGDIFTIILIIVILAVKMDWRLTLITLLVLPLLVFAIVMFRKIIQPIYLRIRKSLAELNAYLGELLSGMKVVKAFTEEKRAYKKLLERNKKYKKANLESVLVYAIFYPTVTILQSLASAVIIWYGGYRILHISMSPGVLIAFLMYVHRIYRPINDLAQKYNILQSAVASSTRIFSVLDSDDRIKNEGKLNRITGNKLEFKNVTFSYSKEVVLNDLTFNLKKGEKIAFVGYTGAGKTTVINLLLRYWDISQGKILIDEKDIKGYELMLLRRKFGLVPQDIYLFEGNIFENITMGNKQISRKDVEKASKEVGLDKVLKKFGDGLDHKVTESGTNLSVGERQLISFTRILLYNPDILILDEPTSNIDTETEKIIQEALKKVLIGRSAIMIAHRLSTIKNADRILVLSHGKLVEEGTHTNLIKNKNGIYYKLYLAQK
jgi:ATP-binding cassette subfamily B protein